MKTENIAAQVTQKGNGGENAEKNGAAAGASEANALNAKPLFGPPKRRK
jgi:hypothetical protein